MNAKPLSQLVDPSWLPALEPVEPIIHEIGERLRAEVSAGRGYLPAGANVLRALPASAGSESADCGSGPLSDAGTRSGFELFGGTGG